MDRKVKKETKATLEIRELKEIKVRLVIKVTQA